MVRCSGRLRIISSSTRPMLTTAFTRVRVLALGVVLDSATLLDDGGTVCRANTMVQHPVLFEKGVQSTLQH